MSVTADGYHVTPTEANLLQSIADDAVTWRHSSRGVSYRLWTSQQEFRLCTPAGKALCSKGMARCAHGWRSGAGPVELTSLGREVLGEVFQ